jgi:hypothetical protein
MKMFWWKKEIQKEMPDKYGWDAFIDADGNLLDDFWPEADAYRNANLTLWQKCKALFSYLAQRFKGSSVSYSENDPGEDFEFDDLEEDAEFVAVWELSDQILEEHKEEFISFAERLLSDDYAQYEFLGKRFIYKRKNHPTNKGFSQISENLDGSDRFELGWFYQSKPRASCIDDITFHLAIDCARLDFEGFDGN